MTIRWEFGDPEAQSVGTLVARIFCTKPRRREKSIAEIFEIEPGVFILRSRPRRVRSLSHHTFTAPLDAADSMDIPCPICGTMTADLRDYRASLMLGRSRKPKVFKLP